MLNRKFFFDYARLHLFDGSITRSQVQGLTSILDYWEKFHAKQDDRWLAYILATVHHETGRKFQPVEEIGKGKDKRYGKMIKYNGKAYTHPMKLYYGRSFCQATWYENYEKIGKKIHLDLLNHPELLLDLTVSVKVLVEGMIEGWFTAKKLSDYINDKREWWLGARYTINGKDNNHLIKSYALKYYASLSYTR